MLQLLHVELFPSLIKTPNARNDISTILCHRLKPYLCLLSWFAAYLTPVLSFAALKWSCSRTGELKQPEVFLFKAILKKWHSSDATKVEVVRDMEIYTLHEYEERRCTYSVV